MAVIGTHSLASTSSTILMLMLMQTIRNTITGSMIQPALCEEQLEEIPIHPQSFHLPELF
jgi:hypothetical protein